MKRASRRAQVVLSHLLPSHSNRQLSTVECKAQPFAPCKSDYLNLDELLTPEERAIRHKVRAFMEKEIPDLAATCWDKSELPIDILVPKLRTLGVGGGSIKGYGCPGMSHLACAMVTMEMARVDTSCSTFLMLQNCVSMATIDMCGSEEQKQRFLPAMARLEKIGCFALTEPDVGSDASAVKTTATPVEGGYIINGQKRWIGNGTVAHYLIIWARNTKTNQIEGFVIERENTTGLKTTKMENKVALRIVHNADIELKNCFVPERNLLAKAKDFSSVNQALSSSRVIVAWQPVGIAMGIYDNTLKYVKEREQFGAPLAAFQLVQERLVRMLGNIQAMMYSALRLSQLHQQGKSTPGQISMVKAWNSLRGREVAAWGREIMGGNGLLTDYHVGKAFTDIEAIYTYEGTYDVNALITGREITGLPAFRPHPSVVSKNKKNRQ
eukprot:TRINITY_DN1132_c0_g1_i1.p1 TRINITY_DN1132_c0_g1~~TRINITY_DN1132_c0_g1_i1.p1  ORF type:complete len:460 (-),score=108.90 TRINITY_DN1132_c0_g1_i1:103-1419(-)